jgi:hypothetical protein
MTLVTQHNRTLGQRGGRIKRFLKALVPAAVLLASVPAWAIDERSAPLPAAGAGGYFPFNPPNNGSDTLESVLKGEGYRLFDFEMNSKGTAGVFISNGPAYGGGINWWMAGGSGIAAAIEKYKARIIDLEIGPDGAPYALLVPNTGSQAKAWSYLIHATSEQVVAHLQKTGDRIVDLERYVRGGKWVFSVVTIANKGADATAWWWYYGVTADQVVDLLKQNKARLIDMESQADGKWAVVMVKQTVASWWYFGVSMDQLDKLCKQHNARVIDLEEYKGKPGTYAAVLIPLKLSLRLPN